MFISHIYASDIHTVHFASVREPYSNYIGSQQRTIDNK